MCDSTRDRDAAQLRSIGSIARRTCRDHRQSVASGRAELCGEELELYAAIDVGHVMVEADLRRRPATGSGAGRGVRGLPRPHRCRAGGCRAHERCRDGRRRPLDHRTPGARLRERQAPYPRGLVDLLTGRRPNSAASRWTVGVDPAPVAFALLDGDDPDAARALNSGLRLA